MKKNGFTLVETLIAIAIVVISIVGPFVTASRALVAAYTARDQLTASYLASEAVEYVRMMRDTMYLADYQAYPSDPDLASDAFCDFSNATPDDPNNGCIQGTDGAPANPAASIGECLGAGDGTTKCALNDPLVTMGTGNGDALSLCTANGCPALYLNSGRYTTATAGMATPFTRSIQFYTVGTEVEVVVTVSWRDNGVPYSTSITDYLSPWE